MLLGSSLKTRLRKGAPALIVYVFAGLATANWLDTTLFSGQVYSANGVEEFRMRIALAGSAVYVLAGLVSLIRRDHGLALGLLATCMSWGYFAFMLAVFSGKYSWRQFSSDIQRDPNQWGIVATFLFFVATLFALIDAWRSKRLREHDAP